MSGVLRNNVGKTRRLDKIIQLEKELKEARDCIKSLERKLKKDEKVEKKEIKTSFKELAKESDKCPDCSSGDVILADLGVRMIASCSKRCGWRKITKI